MATISSSGKSVDSTGSKPVISREAKLMFIKHKRVYKVLGKSAGEKQIGDWERADRDHGLPTPYLCFEKAVLHRNDGQTGYDVYSIVMREISEGSRKFFGRTAASLG
jgi:hypothetical protein